MAGEAAVEDLFGVFDGEREDFGLVPARFDVFFGGSVAGLAALSIWRQRLVHGALLMRILEEGRSNVGVAGAARLVADISIFGVGFGVGRKHQIRQSKPRQKIKSNP